MSGFLCGIIREKEDSMMGELKFVNDFTLLSLREDRMSRMLACDTLMYGSAWNDHTLAMRMEKNEVYKEIEETLMEDLINGFLL